VNVNLTLPSSVDTKNETNNSETKETVNEVNTATPTSVTEVNQRESALPSNETENALLSDEKTDTLLETAACITEEDGNISCKLPNGHHFYIDVETGQIFSGSSKKRASPAPVIKPKFKVLRVNSKGEFDIEFSEEVGLEELIDLGPQKKRQLSKRSGDSKSSK